jgi:RNA polymerase sigma-70 factor (ECF subfamily)
MTPPQQSHGQTPEFVRHLTNSQSMLYAYITALLGGAEGAQDVLQETNVVLWSKASEYDVQRPFLAWAYTCARFQVMAWRKKQSRSRLVLDEALVDQVADEFAGQDISAARHLDALESCIGKLPESHRQLIDSRYAQGEAVNQMATRLGRPQNAIAASLYRIRKMLLECMQAALTGKAGA